MTRKRILEIIPTLDRSGAEKQLALLATGLPKDEFDVEVAVLTRDGPMGELLRAGKIPYSVVGKKLKLSPFAFWKLEKIIRRFQPDLVHTWIFAANAYGRKAAIRCGVKSLVCGERCVDPWKRPWHFFIDRALAKKTDCIAVNSEGIRDFYTAHGLPAEKFTVIPNAVLPPKPSKMTKAEIFARLGIETSDERTPFLIGMVARLWPQKRLDEAIWSCEELKFAGCDFHLLIFGDGPQRDALLRYRDELRLWDRVHFLGHRPDVADFLPHLDLLWSTSAYEGQSNSILEAMAAGVPVLASDIPGNRELIVSGETGLLIPEFDGDKFRRRTMFCKESLHLFHSENASLRRSMGDKAKERIASEFSLAKMIGRYAELYRELIDRSRLEHMSVK